jgi:DNA-binding MarR family transcriptional regulator
MTETRTAERSSGSSASGPCGQGDVSMPELFESIGALAKRLDQFESRTLRESGLTPPQFFVLTQLADGERSLAGLAEAAGCTRATMTGVADTLERNGLAARTPHPTDRRSTLVRLTDAGRDRLANPGLAEAFGNCCCEVLTPDESRELARLLAKLSAALPF